MFGLNRSKRQRIGVILIVVVLVIIAVSTLNLLYINRIKDSYELELTMANNMLEENQKELYVANIEIKKAEVIDKNKLEKVTTFTNLDESFYISEKDIGKVALVDIPLKSPIYKNMVAEYLQNDLREEEFNVFFLNTNLRENDYVDIRLLFPNGEDYIVLSKKSLKNLSLENSNCFMWLNAKETLYISAAIVDTYLHKGAKLYTTKYIEPNIQEASEVTYTPNIDVINLINRDPNVLEKAIETLSKTVRTSLDLRLDTFYQSYEGEVNWEPSAIDNTVVEGSNTEDETVDNTVDNAEDNTDSEEGEYYYVD